MVKVGLTYINIMIVNNYKSNRCIKSLRVGDFFVGNICKNNHSQPKGALAPGGYPQCGAPGRPLC